MRLERESALPDRCVSCNKPVGGHRVARKLYWSPLAWRLGAFLTPFVALGLGIALEVEALMLSFWPLVLVLVIANFFVRKSLRLQFGLCPFHRRLRGVMLVLSTLAIVGVVAGILSFNALPFGPALLLLSIVALVVLSAVQAFFGASALGLKSLDARHAWLTGTGARFRGGLPELN